MFLLMAQFEKVILTLDDVSDLIGLAPRSILNLISQGNFPTRLPGGGFAIQDVAKWIDERRKNAA